MSLCLVAQCEVPKGTTNLQVLSPVSTPILALLLVLLLLKVLLQLRVHFKRQNSYLLPLLNCVLMEPLQRNLD